MEGDASQGFTPGKATVFLSTPGTQAYPMFSPDGRWIAYSFDRSRQRPMSYVRPFPGPGGTMAGLHGRRRLSPCWSATAHELLFLSQGKVMFAPYSVVGDSFRADAPKLWSPTGLRALGAAYPYRSASGRQAARRSSRPRTQSGAVAQDKVVFFFGFGEHLKKIAPSDEVGAALARRGERASGPRPRDSSGCRSSSSLSAGA